MPVAEQQPAATTDAEAQPTSPETETPDAASRDLETVLGELDLLLQANPDAKKELRAHRTLMGIAGDMAHTIAQNMKRDDDTKAQQDAMERLEAQMVEDAKSDPEKFATKWLAGNEAAKTRKQIDEMRQSVESELGQKIGRAVSALPEFQELSPDEVQALTAELASDLATGMSQGDGLARYTKNAVDLVAKKRLAKEVVRLEAEKATWQASELKKEAAALRAEENAKRLKKEQAPSLAAGTSGSASTEPAFDPKPGSDWQRWYEQKHRVRPL